MTFFDLFTDMLWETITVIPGVTNAMGDFVPVGDSFTLPARIEGSNRLVRAPSGEEVVTTVQCICPAKNLSVNRHRYTIPPRFEPYEMLKAIAIERETDETEPVYEVVNL